MRMDPEAAGTSDSRDRVPPLRPLSTTSWIDPRATAAARPPILETLWSRLWMVLLVIAIALAGALVYVKTAQPGYKATSQLIVNPLPSDTAPGVPVLVRESVDPTRDVETVARLITTQEVARRVIARLRLTDTT